MISKAQNKTRRFFPESMMNGFQKLIWTKWDQDNQHIQKFIGCKIRFDGKNGLFKRNAL